MFSALAWGIGDFGGGLASRRVPSATVVLWAQGFGGLIAAAVAIARGEVLPDLHDAAWGMAGGAFGAMALTAFYHGLATGRIGVVAPVAAVLGAAIPVLVAAAIVGPPGTLQLVGMAVGVAGIGLVSRPPTEGHGANSGIGVAVLAGVGIGASFLAMGQIRGESVFAALAIGRIAAVATMLVVITRAGHPARPPRAIAPMLAVVAALDLGGVAGFTLAAQLGRVDISAVLSSMYPVVTILLAAVILRERVGRLQVAGIALAMSAIALIGSGLASPLP